jgi:hypothetical protein
MIINKNGVDYILTAQEEEEHLANIAAIQAEKQATAYVFNRLKEYPTIGDQLDALWKGGEAAAEMLAQVQAVKAKYPKGTA